MSAVSTCTSPGSRAILLGLELLVAGDIIRTVVVQPTLAGVAVLAAIVLIRTLLSLSLELEIAGRWPWQRSAVDQNPGEDTQRSSSRGFGASTPSATAIPPARCRAQLTVGPTQ